LPIIESKQRVVKNDPVRKDRKREFLIRGNFPKNPISELTVVVEGFYTT
jgi:hypothetical protein